MSVNQQKGEFEEDFTPKTANRKTSRRLFVIVAIVIVLGGVGFAGYLIYQGNFYYQTDNAKVDAVVYQLTPSSPGKLEQMYVFHRGEAVTAGEVLARVGSSSLIRSPMDGTIIDIKMQQGDYVTPSDVVLIVANTSDLYITANVEETNILEIHPGQSVTVSLDAYGKDFDGYVDVVHTVTSTQLSGSLSSFNTSGTYTKVTQLIPVKIKLNDSIDLADIIGTNATVKIRVK
jgi:multidrug resistance efflux pump